jgi:hypothetical protein
MSIFDKPTEQAARERALRDIATEKPTGFMQNMQSAWSEFTTNDSVGALDTRRREAYDARIKQVEQLTGQRLDNPLQPPRNRVGIKDPIELVYDLFASDDGAAERERIEAHERSIEAARARLSPQERAQLPTRQDILDTLQRESQDVERQSADVASRSTLGGIAGRFVGGAGAAISQPEVLMTLPIGAPVRAGILARILGEAAIGGAAEAVLQPAVQAQRRDLGLDYGLGPAATNVGVAAAGGAGLTAGMIGIGAVARGGVRAFEKAIGRRATADERALVEAVQQDVQMERVNPYEEQSAAAKAVKEQNEALAFDAAVEGRRIREDELVSDEALTRTLLQGDGSSGLQTIRNADLDRIGVDARLMQFKSDGDEFGVTDRLRGVTEWNVERAGIAMIYEFDDGRQIIADGHQRLGLAKRLASEGKDIEMLSLVMRQADGITPEQARARAAFKNIAEGTGSSVDAAKVLRDMGATAEDMGLPPKSALVRDAEGLTNLDDETFGMVVNKVISEQFGAIVGRLVNDPMLQPSIAGLLARLKPANAVEAESIVRQAREAGSTRETQTSLFGDEDIAESLYLERARVLDRGMKMLRRNIETFRTLNERGETITAAGNILDAESNAARLEVERTLQQYVVAQANRKGVVGNALTEAARSAKESGNYAAAARQFTETVTRAIERGEINGDALSRSGADPEFASEGPETAGVDESAIEPIDRDTLSMFDDPVGPASEEQSLRLAAEIEDVANVQRERMSEPGADGEQQILIDGVPPVRDADRASLRSAAPMRGSNNPMDIGLFGSSRDQADLMDFAIPIGERLDANGARVAETATIRDIMADLEADQEFVSQLALCDRPRGAA